METVNKKLKFYRVIKNYSGDFVSIDETELEKAIYAFETNAKVKFRRGVARGQDILDIKPDYNKALGYNPDYKILPEDYGVVNRLKKSHEELYQIVNKRVDYLIENNQIHLIGKNIDIPALENQEVKVLSGESKKIADKFRVN